MKFAVEARGIRVKRDGDNLHPELDAPLTFVDLWLAENPADKDEAAMDDISAVKIAAAVSGNFVGFEKEAGEVAAGVEKYGSLEEYQKHQFEGPSLFADSPRVPFKEQFDRTFASSAPRNGSFQSYLGNKGIYRTPILKCNGVQNLLLNELSAPSKEVNLSDDFNF
jgi:hypothetical protein